MIWAPEGMFAFGPIADILPPEMTTVALASVPAAAKVCTFASRIAYEEVSGAAGRRAAHSRQAPIRICMDRTCVFISSSLIDFRRNGCGRSNIGWGTAAPFRPAFALL